jgi:Transposase
MPGDFLPDIGSVVVETVSELPTERAAAILERATGHTLSTATMKRTTAAVGNALRDEEAAFFNARLRRRRLPDEARSVIISVDGLSFNVRGEGYKLATAATISLLDGRGERLTTTKLGEMPEEGKTTIMDRVEREVRAFLKQRPDLKTEVIIDGAPDLRAHLLTRFPDAPHVTDFRHVVEHIADALRTIFPHDEKLRDATRTRLCHELKHEKNGARRIIAWLRDPFRVLDARMDKQRQGAVDAHADYMQGQLRFLNYAKAANDILDLGSGAVEAACKTLVTQRLKISGAKWSRRGARAILYLRPLAQSRRLDDAPAFHQTRRLMRAA